LAGNGCDERAWQDADLLSDLILDSGPSAIYPAIIAHVIIKIKAVDLAGQFVDGSVFEFPVPLPCLGECLRE
jgi:hypothetical protein